MDMKKYFLCSLIILLVAINSFLIVTTVYGNDQITQKFNFEKLDEYIGVLANENRVIFDYNINQEFIQTELSFNVDEKILNKKNTKIEMKFNIDEIIQNSKLDFVMGFTSLDEMIHSRGYFNIKVEDEKLVFENYGKNMKFNKVINLLEKDNEIKITYLIDEEKNNIKMLIEINDDNLELNSKLNEEFKNGFKLNDFMFSVNELSDLKLTISDLKLIY